MLTILDASKAFLISSCHYFSVEDEKRQLWKILLKNGNDYKICPGLTLQPFPSQIIFACWVNTVRGVVLSASADKSEGAVGVLGQSPDSVFSFPEGGASSLCRAPCRPTTVFRY